MYFFFVELISAVIVVDMRFHYNWNRSNVFVYAIVRVSSRVCDVYAYEVLFVCARVRLFVCENVSFDQLWA